MQNTNPQALVRAEVEFQSDWDSDGTTSVYLPRGIARDLLLGRGWTCRNDGREWLPPAGCAGSFWHETDEALQLALAAEVV